MRKRALTLFIIMLFVLPPTLSFVTNPGGSNFQNVTELVKEPVLSYEEEPIKHLACDGSVDTDLYIDGDYWDTWTDDASYLSAYPINYTGIHLIFNITERLPLIEINFFLRWQVTVSGPADQPKPVYWMIYNFDTSSYDTVYSEILGESLSWEDREESITFDENYINSTNYVRFYAYGSNIYVDEIEVDYAYLTVIKGYDGEFRETLPDDLGYSPDSVSRTSFATGGEAGYENTYAVDGVCFNPFFGDEIIEIECEDFYDIEYFDYAVYGNTTSSMAIYYSDDGETWTEYFTVVDEVTLEWYNGTETDVSPLSNIASSGIFYLYFDHLSWIDYLSITFYYTIGLSENIYAESFFDISDWSTWVGDGINSDGDVGYVDVPDDASHDRVYTNVPSIADGQGMYLEFRFKGNVTADASVEVIGYTLDNHAGTETQLWGGTVRDYWQTIKIIIDESLAIESVAFIYYVLNGVGGRRVYTDYFRIGSADEMGWQFDGSTPQGADSISYGGSGSSSITSDGDIFHYQGNYTDWSGPNFKVDSSTTAAYASLNYYQFLEVRMNASATQDIKFKFKDENGAYTTYSDYEETGDFTTVRINLQSLVAGDYLQYVRIYDNVDGLQDFDVDHLKLYSIANYTVTESSTTSDDFLYEEVGVLHSSMDDGEFILDYDPAFNFTGSYTVTKTTTSGESYLSFDRDGWTDYSNETTVTLYAGSTTGLRIKLNETANIQTIEFSVRQAQWVLIGTVIIYFDMPNWWFIATMEAVFYLPFSELTLQLFMMIMGLVMIPFSTLFLVMGGKDEMDRDKLYFFLLMFLIGWALVLGGII